MGVQHHPIRTRIPLTLWASVSGCGWYVPERDIRRQHGSQNFRTSRTEAVAVQGADSDARSGGLISIHFGSSRVPIQADVWSDVRLLSWTVWVCPGRYRRSTEKRTTRFCSGDFRGSNDIEQVPPRPTTPRPNSPILFRRLTKFYFPPHRNTPSEVDEPQGGL